MSLSTAVALLALLFAVFACLAVGAVYRRLRLLEWRVAKSGDSTLADVRTVAPESLRPREGDAGVVALLLDDSCSLCQTVWESLAGHETPGIADAVRLVAVLPSAGAAGLYAGSTTEINTDPDVWRALYEGYTPCLYWIDAEGRVADRRFIYPDTDVVGLLRDVVPVSRSSGGSNAP
jgi:hypothetical protein